MSIAVIVGSAFTEPVIGGVRLVAEPVETAFGTAVLHRYPPAKEDAWVLFRHGAPHLFLPNQIPYRANAAALHAKGCAALLVTSSVGVLSEELPLFEPLLLGDLILPDNRLPDGSACTMFPEPTPGQGHLVVEGGLFSQPLADQVAGLARELEWPTQSGAVFAYAPGPRTKTAAENRYWRAAGAQVNSMTLAPEVVLANELEIPTAGLVVGHKYSIPGLEQPLDRDSIEATLERTAETFERLITLFLTRGHAVPFGNRLYRF